MAALGSGALMKFILMGETASTLGWLTGAAFIPSLALALGTLTGSGKAFEAVYVLWMYMLTQRVPSLDFVGMTAHSPLYVYAPLALVLFAIAALARQWQLNPPRVSRRRSQTPLGAKSGRGNTLNLGCGIPNRGPAPAVAGWPSRMRTASLPGGLRRVLH